jgi:hypothetical protein
VDGFTGNVVPLRLYVSRAGNYEKPLGAGVVLVSTTLQDKTNVRVAISVTMFSENLASLRGICYENDFKVRPNARNWPMVSRAQSLKIATTPVESIG